MTTTHLLLILGVILGIVIGYLVAKVYFLSKLKHQRKDAVKRSRSVVLGDMNEKIAPLLPDFPYSYKDLVYLGKGIDYLVFDGLSRGILKQIVFLEIKSGTSGLNKNERMIKNCIDAKQVSYRVWKK